MSISVVGYTEDHFNPSAILNDLHAHAAVELWVGTCDPALSPSERNGAANAPFANIAEAMTYIATRPETAFVVHLAPESWSDATLVAGKYIVLEGPMRGMCSLSTITIPSSPTTTALFMRNCNVLSLEFSGTAGESAIALLENTNVTSGISNPNNIQCQVLMKAFRDSESSIGSSTVAGPINLGSQGTFDAGGVFLGGKLTVQKFRLVDSILPTEIEVINGLDSVVERSEWQHTNPTITHTGSSANVHFDAYSAKSFGLQSGSILNGGVIQGEEGPYLLQADSTFSAFQLAAPALLAGHVQLASATPDVATLGVVYPAVASGALALVWPSGTRIPASPVSGAGSYYRDSTTGSASLASSTQPIGNSDGSLFYVEISSLNANSTFTQGSVLFAGASGVYSQNNSQLFWDNTNFRLGIGTATPAAELDNVGFTKLGSLSPLLKVYYVTGTTHASDGGQASVNLDASIASSKIISVSAMVEYSTDSFVGPGSVSTSGQQFDWSINSGSPVSLSIHNVTGNSAGILSKPFRAVIVYIA